MTSAGLDAFIIYTNLVRPSAVTWLTGFTPYWSEGLLLVPMTGRLAFATALSNRVADWIRATNPVSDVVSTPAAGDAAGRAAGQGRFWSSGSVSWNSMPCRRSSPTILGLPRRRSDGLTEALEFAMVRRDIDPAEQQILMRSDAIAVAALDQV